MNFQTTLEELDKLYEREPVHEDVNTMTENTGSANYCWAVIDEHGEYVCAYPANRKGLADAAARDMFKATVKKVPFMESLAEDVNEDTVEEPTEEEVEVVEDDEEIEVVDEQLVLECSKCGCLVIKEESDVTVDEEAGVANVDEPCAFCEASEGYHIIGTFTPNSESEVVSDATENDKSVEAEAVEAESAEAEAATDEE